jgi:hypothetical protein
LHQFTAPVDRQALTFSCVGDPPRNTVTGTFSPTFAVLNLSGGRIVTDWDCDSFSISKEIRASF